MAEAINLAGRSRHSHKMKRKKIGANDEMGNGYDNEMSKQKLSHSIKQVKMNHVTV